MKEDKHIVKPLTLEQVWGCPDRPAAQNLQQCPRRLPDGNCPKGCRWKAQCLMFGMGRWLCVG